MKRSFRSTARVLLILGSLATIVVAQTQVPAFAAVAPPPTPAERGIDGRQRLVDHHRLAGQPRRDELQHLSRHDVGRRGHHADRVDDRPPPTRTRT